MGFVANLASSLVGVLIGAAVTWLVSWWYYAQATEDLKKETGELRQLVEILGRGLEAANLVRFNRDHDGKLTGVIFNEGVTISAQAGFAVNGDSGSAN